MVPADGEVGVSDRELYEGFALQAVDDKGRVAIPADLRVTFDRNSVERVLMVGKHSLDPCLIAHDIAWSQANGMRIAERNERALDEGRVDAVDPRAGRNLHGRLDRAKLDSSNRVILSPYHLDRVKIGDWAFFLGVGNQFEIWAPEVLVKTDTVDDEIRDICRFYCQQKGVAL